MVVVGVLVWFYGIVIAVVEDLERGMAYAGAAALVLMVVAWRRGVFTFP